MNIQTGAAPQKNIKGYSQGSKPAFDIKYATWQKPLLLFDSVLKIFNTKTYYDKDKKEIIINPDADDFREENVENMNSNIWHIIHDQLNEKMKQY